MKIRKLLPTLLALSTTVSVSNGALKVQELFDNISAGDATLNGAGDTTTSVGMTGTWTTSGAKGTQIYTANNFNVNGSTLPGLPPNGGAQGGIYFNAWQFPATWDTDIYATRPLVNSINFATSQTLYFSVRLNNSGDTAMGLGLATGAGGTDQFIGAGLHWNTATALDGQNCANATYITYGTLGQDLAGNNNGPYAAQAHEAAGSVNGPTLLVGRLTLNAVGNDLIEIKRYGNNEVIDTDLSSIAWTVASSVDSSMDASQLLLWMNGQGQGELDALRFGDTWNDVTGVPEPSTLVLGALGVLMLAVCRRRR